MSGPIEVVVGIVVDTKGRYLMAQRPAGKVYEGYWEFPGGKVEPGESCFQALYRELEEELGIQVTQCSPWFSDTFVYPHAHVRLSLFRVTQWQGQPEPLENQKLAWQGWGEEVVSPMLPANQKILNALQLPVVYGITDGQQMTEPEFLESLERACFRGLRLIQLREKDLPPELLYKLAEKVMVIAKHYSAQVLINSSMEIAQAVKAHGVHLTAQQLISLTARPDFPIVACSCHNQIELHYAQRLGCDFAVLGPVQTTQTHPEQLPLGWEQFTNLIQNCSFPVYALGGMQSSMLTHVFSCHGQGIASMSHIWRDNTPIANRFRSDLC